LIDIQERIAHFLPSWKAPDKADLTLEDLLRHESGLTEWRPFYITCRSIPEVHAMIASLPLKYPARTGFHYSDLNFITLGEIVNRIYASDLATIFAREVAQPFELRNTQFASASTSSVAATSIGDSIERKMVESKVPYEIPEVADDFAGWRSEIIEGEINDGNSFHCFGGVAGHAGLFSTLNDLIRYSRGLIDSYSDDGPIRANTLAQFSQPRLESAQGVGFRRYLMRENEFAIGHLGFTGTGIAIDLRRANALIYLSNRLHTTGAYLPMAEIWRPELTELAELA
jgi:CubicO group peptidase (beta-lactamase class C family)